MKRILFALLIILIGIQFIPLERTNPPVSLDINAPENITAILRTSCYDCHSNETNWPWYSHVAPVSFMVVDDVKEGRKHLNFSEWDKYNGSKRQKLLEEIFDEVKREEMPLTLYTFTHPNAKLDPYRIQLLENWIRPGSSVKESLRYK